MTSGLLLLASCAVPELARKRMSFVRRDGLHLWAGGARYRFVGTNMWHAAYLGAQARYGNRRRLTRELNRLAALGLTNVRILGSSELSPLKNSVTPAFRTRSGDYDETLLRGLDFALAEMGERTFRRAEDAAVAPVGGSVVYIAVIAPEAGGAIGQAALDAAACLRSCEHVLQLVGFGIF